MITMNLQEKTKAIGGKVSTYWFENLKTGLKKTHFHRIEINLAPFDSGIEYESQPTSTSITIEWLELGENSIRYFEDQKITSKEFPRMEASVYLGAAHNWCAISDLRLQIIENSRVKIQGIVEIDFESEAVAKNECFAFECELEQI